MPSIPSLVVGAVPPPTTRGRCWPGGRGRSWRTQAELPNSTYAVLHPLAPCYDLPVQFHPRDHTKIIPDLADRWEISPNGRVHTFHLKRDVKFHHSNPFKAEDVKASFERTI